MLSLPRWFAPLSLLMTAGCAAVLAATGDTSREHAPSAYKVPAGLVFGGAYIDRIQPMPVHRGLTTNVWGGDNVKPRDADNGLEDPQWSYWCMNVHRAADGREHMFAVRWPESSPKGHMAWPQSQIVHAVADLPTGPFVVQQEIGPGHNVQCYRAKDGTYLLYANKRAYTSKSLEGPWTNYPLQYDSRGAPAVKMSNQTFTQREDGSYLMMSREGQVWISEDGLQPYKQITIQSAYPPIEGRFEDPVVWRDEVQYNLIVNDWFGRTAFYLRSKDGVRWVWDPGLAYDVSVTRHPDGTRESWYKFERPNVRQDEFRRPTHIYFAVIDSPKNLDKPNDNHSSKIIALPLTVPRRLEILNSEPGTSTVRHLHVTIKAESGFDPLSEVVVSSLTFGAPSVVDFGKGCRAETTKESGRDLIVTFPASGHGFTADDFAGKLLGKTKRGELLFGYARLPGQTYIEPILRSRAPQMSRQAEGELELRVPVENFGQVASSAGWVEVGFTQGNSRTRLARANFPAIRPYGRHDAVLTMPAQLRPGVYAAEVILHVPGRPAEVLPLSEVNVP
jgi:hypothetical protein